jgi:hypothetical protein
MVEQTSRYYRPDTLTPAEQLRQEYMGLEQIKKQLARAKVNSPEYKKALAAKTATEKRIADLEKLDKAERATVTNEKAAKERTKLKEDLQRAEDYGTPAEQTKAKEALDNFDNKNPTVVPETTKSTVADTDGDGIPDTVDAQPKVPNKPTPTPTPTSDKKDKVTPSPTPEADKIKTAWVGYLEATFKTLPKEYKAQIDKLLTTAKTEKWQEGTFTEALKQTSWWQQTLPSLRSFFIETHDPRNAATFAEKLSLNTANVAASLEKLGIRTQQVDPVTGKVVDNTATIQGIAMDAIKNGWNEVQTLQHIGDNAQILFTGGGTIGSSVDNIKKQALNYGINIDNNYLDTIQRSLLDPTDGRDQQYYLNEMKAQAMDLYKPFASSLKEGRSLYEVTNSYRNQMATLLEVDSTNVTWKDLMSKVVDPTTGNARTFADFNKQVKQDPLWQYTKNAKETYSNTALDLMKQFGFMG